MKNLLVGLACLFAVGVSRAQDCLGVKFKSGMGYEMLSYTAKDKPNGRLVYKIKNVRKEGGATVLEVAMQSFDEKDNAGREMPLVYTCTGNELVVDLSGLAPMTSGAAGKDMEVRVKSSKLVYPQALSESTALQDGEMQAEMYNGGQKMMDMTMTMVNRKIEGQENLTTPAGTFAVYKVSSEMNVLTKAMGIPIRSNFRSVSYRSNQVLFDVKTETYNKNGKLMGYMVLNKILEK